MFYNITVPASPSITFFTPELAGDTLLTIHLPASGAGYIDWVCNIPVDHGLIVGVRDAGGVLRTKNYVVDSGAIESCLVDLTARYSVVDYGTNFPSYTAASSPLFRTILPTQGYVPTH
jgi:hypothetical protein